MSDIVIGTTVPPFKALSGEATQWLDTAEDMATHALAEGFRKVYFFAAIEHDSRTMSPFADLLTRLETIDSEHDDVHGLYWTFSLDDGVKTITAEQRLVRITTGRNLIREFALRNSQVSHLLYIDSDVNVPGDCIPKLLEVDKPVVGGDVPVYCLSGSVAPDYDFPVQIHMNTAGFLLVNRDVIREIPWRSDLDVGRSDDPCFDADLKERFGVHTYVRKDVVGVHKPLRELFNRGHDLRIMP